MTGEEIRRWRLRRGLTQSEAGEALGVVVATVKSWERGRNPIPETAAKLARALDHIDALSRGIPHE